jgi:hypothetical protein
MPDNPLNLEPAGTRHVGVDGRPVTLAPGSKVLDLATGEVRTVAAPPPPPPAHVDSRVWNDFLQHKGSPTATPSADEFLVLAARSHRLAAGNPYSPSRRR